MILLAKEEWGEKRLKEVLTNTVVFVIRREPRITPLEKGEINYNVYSMFFSHI